MDTVECQKRNGYLVWVSQLAFELTVVGLDGTERVEPWLTLCLLGNCPSLRELPNSLSPDVDENADEPQCTNDDSAGVKYKSILRALDPQEAQ